MKQQHKQRKSQKVQQVIQEIHLIDIDGKLSFDLEIINDQDQQSTIISQLEEMLPDNSSILISLLRFYLKLIGLGFCTKWLNTITLENIDIKELIVKQEQLQKENQQNLIDEEKCLQIEKNTQMVKFFEALFSSQTNLPFECDQFFQYNFTWLTTLTQIQYRHCRLAAVEIVRVVVNCLLQQTENIINMNQNLQSQNHKIIIKFLNNIYQYLATYRVQDVQCQIKKKVIGIIFTGFFCDYLPTEAFHNFVGTIFTSENHESRELALIELEKCIHAFVDSKKSLNRITEFLNQQQVSLISLIFDQNESIQIKLIQFLKVLSQIQQLLSNLKVVQLSFFNEASSQAFIRILFTNNPRVRYESTFLLSLFSPQITNLQELIRFFIQQAPFQAHTFKDYFNYVTSFLDSHPFVYDPKSYSQLFDNQDNSEQQNLGFYFYASMLNFERKKKKFWWIDENSINTQDDFTHYFENSSQVRFDLLDENQMLPYLCIIANLNFTILTQSYIVKILENIQRIISQQENQDILYQSFKSLRKCQEQLIDSQVVQAQISSITKYLQSQYKNQLNNTIIYKLTYAFKHNILLGWKRFLEPLNKVLDYQGENCLKLKVGLLESCLINSLKELILNFKKQDRDLEETYSEIRQHFYNFCLLILENKNQNDMHLFILQIVLKNLVYTNNHPFEKFGLEFILTTPTLDLLSNLLKQHLFNDVKKSNRQSNKKQSSCRIDQFPNLNLDQIELFNKCVKLLGSCPSILTTPLGLTLTRNLLNLTRNNEYFRNLARLVTSAISQSLLKILQLDQETKRNSFWVFVKQYAEMFYTSQTEDEFGDFVQTCFTIYYTTVNSKNQVEKKNEFMSNCAEMIVFGFKELKFLYLFGLLNHIFQRPKKLLKVLGIDKQVYQKFYAFYDSKSIEFYKSERPEEEKKEIEKTEKQLKNKLKQMSGLNFKVLEKIQEQKISASKQGSFQKVFRNEDAIKMNELENEDEEEIPFTKQMKK